MAGEAELGEALLGAAVDASLSRGFRLLGVVHVAQRHARLAELPGAVRAVHVGRDQHPLGAVDLVGLAPRQRGGLGIGLGRFFLSNDPQVPPK